MKFSKILTLLCILLALFCIGLTACKETTEPPEGPDSATPGVEQPSGIAQTTCSHEHTECRNAKAATCEEDGYTGDTVCLDCSETISLGQTITKLGHSWNDGAVTKSPTCTSIGEKTYACTREGCTKTKTESVSSLGHAWDAGSYANPEDAPTCTTGGTKTYTCTRDNCGATRTEAVAALGHSHTIVVETPATCTTAGYTTHTCERCTDSYTTDEVSAPGHAWDAGSYANPEDAPTCTTGGTKTYTCTRDNCGATRTEAVAALGHSYTIVNETPATCTAQGYTTYTCSACGDSYVSDYTDATGHNYVSAVTAPTCTAQGYTTYTCSVCDDSYVSDYTDATGHNYVPAVTAPTCTTQGYTTYTCSVCDDSYKSNYTDATGHNYVPAVTAPTCTAQGYTTYTCSVCGDSYVSDYTDATGHTWNGGSQSKAPTHDTPGTMTYTCAACGDTKEEDIQPTGHVWNSGVVIPPTCTEQGYTIYTCSDPEDSTCNQTYIDNYTDPRHTYVPAVTAPTCTTRGYTTYTCSVCGDSYVSDFTDATGHNYVSAVTAPTCTAQGYTTYTCSVCDDTYTETVPALGHNYTDTVTAPTCTTAGYTTHECSRCADSYVDSEVSALGHAWDGGEITTPATCTSKGVKTYTCTREGCGATRTEDIPIAEHTPKAAVEENIVKATCEEGGSYDLVVRCADCNAIISSEHKELPATGHKAADERTGVKVATCGTAGYTGDLKCTVCGTTIEFGETTSATGEHSWNEGEITKNATCTEAGKMTQTCTVCGAHQSVEIPVVVHVYEYAKLNESFHRLSCTVGREVREEKHTPAGEGTFVQPDCTVNGYYVYTCSGCGATYQVVAEGTAKAHNWGEWVVITPATCTNAGEQRHTCSDCDNFETESIPVSAEAHVWVLDHTEDASCTATGTRYYRCSEEGCGETKTETIPMKPHIYTTYEDGGYTVKHCTTCELESRTISSSATETSATVSTESLNKDKAADVELKDATIQLPGEVLEQIKEKAAATAAANVEIKADILSEEDKTATIGKVEDETTKSALEKANIFDFGILVDNESLTSGDTKFAEKVTVTLPYTLKENEEPEGIVVWYVDDDGNVQSVEADYFELDGIGYVKFTTDHFSYYAIAHVETPAMRCAKGEHAYTIEAKVVAATCYSQGYTIMECEHCHTTMTTNFTDRLEHQYGESEVVAATCEEQGYTLKTCTLCGHQFKSNYTAALGHTPDHAATCTEASRCETCGVILVPALGHNWSEWTTVAEATATREGVRQRYCPQCGTIEQTRVAKLIDASAIEFNSYQDLVSKVLDELIRGENAGVDFDFYSMQQGANNAKITAAKINGQYVLLITYTSKDYETDEPTLENVYIKNGLMVQFSEDGKQVSITPYGGSMSIEAFKQSMATGFAQYDAMAKMAFEQARAMIGEYGESLDVLLELLSSPVKSGDLETFVIDTQAFYVYLAQRAGLQTELFMDADANLPTMKDILNIIGKLGTVNETLTGKIYTISLEDLWAKLIAVADRTDELTDETVVAEMLFDLLKDEIQEIYPDMETVNDLKAKIAETVRGDMTAKELIDLLISVSESSEEFELADLYASINKFVKLYASVMPTGGEPVEMDAEPAEAGEEDEGGFDLTNFDVESILTEYYELTLDQLLETFMGEGASVEGLLNTAFGITLGDIPVGKIPMAGQYLRMFLGKEDASVPDVLGFAAQMIRAYQPTLKVVIEADDFGNILNISIDGKIAIDPNAMGGGSVEPMPGISQEIPYGVFAWRVDETGVLHRAYDGDRVWYFYETGEGENIQYYIATYTEIGDEDFEEFPLEKMGMTVDQFVEMFRGMAVENTINLDELWAPEEAPDDEIEDGGEDAPAFVTLYEIHLNVVINSEIAIEVPALNIPNAVPTVTENADGSITVGNLPEGYEWDIDISGSGVRQESDEDKTIYGEYVSIEDELERDAALSAKAGVDVYRVPDKYSKNGDTSNCVKIGDKYYRYYESGNGSYERIAERMISLSEFFADPMANMEQVGSFENGETPVYLCIFGYVFQNEEGNWVAFDLEHSGYHYNENDELIVYRVEETYPLPAEGTEFFFESYSQRSENEFTYGGRTYVGYGDLFFSANEHQDVYSVLGCVIDGKPYVLGSVRETYIRGNTYYVIAEEETGVDQAEFYKTLESVAYRIGNETAVGTLNVYKVTTIEPSYVAKIGDRYYYGRLNANGDSDELYFEDLFGVNVYGLETRTLSDGNTMYVLGTESCNFYGNGESDRILVTYGYVNFGNLYAFAYTYGETVVYPGAYSAPAAFRSYEEILGESNLYGMQENGTYRISAKLMERFKGDSYLYLMIGGIRRILPTEETEGATYLFQLPVVSRYSSSDSTGEKEYGVSFDYWEIMDHFRNFRMTLDRDDSLIIAVSEGDDSQSQPKVHLNGSYASENWDTNTATYERALSEASGLSVWSHTGRNKSGRSYVLENGQYYEYTTESGPTIYTPKSTFNNLSVLRNRIRITSLSFFANGAYEKGEGDEEDTFTEDAIYRVRISYSEYTYYAQMRNGELWILTGVQTDGDILNYTGAVSYAEFIGSLEFSQVSSYASGTLENGTEVRWGEIAFGYGETRLGSGIYVYYYLSNGSNVYFTDYTSTSVRTMKKGALATLPAAYEVGSSYTETYTNGSYTTVYIYCYESYTEYAVLIDGKFYQASLDNGEIRQSSSQTDDYSFDLEAFDLSAYVTVINGRTLRVSRELLSVMQKYNSHSLNFNGRYISLNDLQSAFDGSDNGKPEENHNDYPKPIQDDGYVEIIEEPIKD